MKYINHLKYAPTIVGHRGACGYAPENTQVSLVEAARAGIKWVEFDVMLTQCRQVILFHDDTLERTTNGHGQVGDYTYAQLQYLDVGSWFAPKFAAERIPLLTEVLKLLDTLDLCANIELKPAAGDDENLAAAVAEIMQPILEQANNRFIFSSFSLPALTRLQQLLPGSNRGLLLHTWPVEWQEWARQLNCISIHVNARILTVDKIHAIHGLNKLALAYTVNSRWRAQNLFAAGIDGVFTDVPKRMLKYLNQLIYERGFINGCA